MAGIGAGDFSPRRIDGDVRHRDELARGDLVDDDVVRKGEEIAGLRMFTCERAEHELRHRHVGGRLDAVTCDVAEHDGEASVDELKEVVDVAADVDSRRRLVHLAHLEARDRGLLTRE